MALKYEESYYKISCISFDYSENVTVLYAKRYCSENDRIREKELLPGVDKFKKLAEDTIEKMTINFRQKVLDVVNEEEAMNYVLNHEELKKELDYIDALRNEYQISLFNTLYQDIDLSNLKFLSFWNSIGFLDEMAESVKFQPHYKHFVFKGIFNDCSLENAYIKLKELLPGSEDC